MKLKQLLLKAIFILSALCSELAYSQPSINWKKSFGGSQGDIFQSVVQTKDGGYILVGFTESHDKDVTDNGINLNRKYAGWIVRLESNGSILWTKTLGYFDYGIFHSVIQTKDGGYALAGMTNSTEDGKMRAVGSYWVVKLANNEGLGKAPDVEWEKIIRSGDGGGFSQAHSILETFDGGYLVGGWANSPNHTDDDYGLVKLDNTGKPGLAPNVEWYKFLGGTGNELLRSVAQTKDGGYIIAGSSQSNDGDIMGGHHGNKRSGFPPDPNALLSDCWVVKLERAQFGKAPEIEWQKSLGGTDHDYAYSIIQTKDGGYVFVGESDSKDGDVGENRSIPPYQQSDCWIVKLDNNGKKGLAPDIEWKKSFGGKYADAARSVSETTDGGYIIGAYTYSNDGDVTSLYRPVNDWVVKFDNSGIKDHAPDLQWQKTLGGNGDDGYGNCTVIQTKDNGYLVAGSSDSKDGDVVDNNGVSDNKGSDDFWVVKFDPCPVANINITASANNINYGCLATFTANTINGGINPTYQWKINNDIVPNNNNSIFTTNNLKDGDQVSCIMTTSQCKEKVKSNIITMRVNVPINHSYGGEREEKVYSSIKTLDGGYIMAGYTTSPAGNGDITNNHGQKDMWVIKTNGNGDKEWESSYGGSNDEEAHSIIQTPEDGGYIIAGYTNSQANGIPNGDVYNNNGSRDVYVVKTDAKGHIIWSNTYGGSSAEEANSIVELWDNKGNSIGYAIAGSSNSNDWWVTNNGGNSGTYDMVLMYIDKKGQQIGGWGALLGGSQNEAGNSLFQTTDGGIIIAGNTTSNDNNIKNHGDNSGTQDILVYKFDNTGKLQWQRTYGGSNNEGCNSIIQTRDLGYILAGYTQSKSNDGDIEEKRGGMSDIWVIKIKPDVNKGEIEWQKTYGGEWDEIANNIIETSDGGYAIAGSKSIITPSSSYINYEILKIRADYKNSSGQLIHGEASSERQIGGNGVDIATGIIEERGNGGGYTVIGYSSSKEGNNGIKLSGHTGQMERDGSFEYWMVQLTTCPEDGTPQQTTQKEKESITQINPNTKVQVAPNPFTQKTTLTLNNIQPNKKYTLVITDIYGRRVRQINNITTSTIEINRGNLAAGIYEYQLLDRVKAIAMDKMIVE